MLDKNIIDVNIIKSYDLENEEFECPVCCKYFNALALNGHYKKCYLNYIKEIQDEVNERNKNIEEENNNNYYKSLINYLFEKMNEIDFSKVLMNHKLEFINIDFKNSVVIFDKHLKTLEDNFDNVILFDSSVSFKGNQKTYLINNNETYDYKDYDDSILFMNSSNLYKKNISELMLNSENNEINYFSDVNVLQFISKLLNISITSKIIILIYLVKITSSKITVYNNNSLLHDENIYLKHLHKLDYINYINDETSGNIDAEWKQMSEN